MRIRDIDLIALACIIAVFIVLFTAMYVIMYHTIYTSGSIGRVVSIIVFAGIICAFIISMMFLLINYSIWAWVRSYWSKYG